MIIIGGGLAGLTNAILLGRAGLKVQLFEEKKYPFHRVCGEYISKEVIPFLKANDLYPEELEPCDISRFHLSSVSGKVLKLPLDLGGFGVSRYAYDQWLAQKAKEAGVEIIHGRIIQSEFHQNGFELADKSGRTPKARIVIGAFGKRSTLDKSLERPFIQKRSPYVGVKYHIKTDVQKDNVIALHNFNKGYCGISRVENDTFNLCYLTHRSNVKKYGSLSDMEEEVLMRNPLLKEIFRSADHLFKKPEVINEVTFERKEPVYNHMIMTGDSAGMITPLCGNGMAMAIHSAKLSSELIIKSFKNGFDQSKLERDYSEKWNQQFA
ncbi:MAG: NAD(P)/FAD-dependent oxidoreductase, partial [Ekhidna sp.]